MVEVLTPALFFLVFVGILGGSIALVVRTVVKNREKRSAHIGEDLGSLAAGRGWSYFPRSDGYLERYTGYPFDRGGPERTVFDLVTGTHRDRRFACFQFLFHRSRQPGEGVVERTYMRVLAVQLSAALPWTMVRRAHMDPRWQRGFTTGDDDFDKELFVATRDEQFTRQMLTEPVKRWLSEYPPLGGVADGSVEFQGAELVAVFTEKDAFDARLVEPALDYLCDLLDQLPVDTSRGVPPSGPDTR